MKKSIRNILYVMLFAPWMVACDNIAENERLIYEKPETAKRVVLLEDFTGQRCVNCPKATEVIEQLQEEFGDALIAVGIHGGPLGFKGSASTTGLATTTGDEYYSHWNLEYQPVALVNRHAPVNYPEWAAAVKEQAAIPTTLSIGGEAVQMTDGRISMSIELQSTDGTTTGKLQLWLIEDGITALQLMPDGSSDREYVHNHVLRTPVNGTWGEAFSLTESKTQVFEYDQALDPAWNADKLSIVAFAYNDQGVIQATKIPISKHSNN